MFPTRVATILAAVLLTQGAFAMAPDSPQVEPDQAAQSEPDPDAASEIEAVETPTLEERLPLLIAALFGDDEYAAAEARYALLLAPLDHDALVALAAAADSRLHLAIARDIAKHHVLTRLRHEELADLEDDTVIVGFQFQATATAGQVGPDTAELVDRFPFGALISSTTAGFPGYVHLRPGDMIVLLDGEPLPQDRITGQQHVIDTVRNHTPDETMEMSVIRDGVLVELTIPFARAMALPKIYSARTISRDLIDPFLFLWEEAWDTIMLDAGYDEEVD